MVGSGGGVLAGGLTVAGGVMTVMTAGAALPVLVAVGKSFFCIIFFEILVEQLYV